jgi:hypothetical protein
MGLRDDGARCRAGARGAGAAPRALRSWRVPVAGATRTRRDPVVRPAAGGARRAGPARR